jgi:hypothetical protein
LPEAFGLVIDLVAQDALAIDGGNRANLLEKSGTETPEDEDHRNESQQHSRRPGIGMAAHQIEHDSVIISKRVFVAQIRGLT